MRSSRRCNSCARSGGGSVAGRLLRSPWRPVGRPDKPDDRLGEPVADRHAAFGGAADRHLADVRRHASNGPAPGSIVRGVGLAAGPRRAPASTPQARRGIADRCLAGQTWIVRFHRSATYGRSRVEPVVWRPSRARWASAASRSGIALIDLDLDRAALHHLEQLVRGRNEISARGRVGHQRRPGQDTASPSGSGCRGRPAGSCPMIARSSPACRAAPGSRASARRLPGPTES